MPYRALASATEEDRPPRLFGRSNGTLESWGENGTPKTAKLAGLTSFRLARYKKPEGLLVELSRSQPPVELTPHALTQNGFHPECRYLGDRLW
jgi:hypothetical protein